VSQVLTLYTTPVVYLYLERFGLWCSRKWARLHPERPPAAAAAHPL
jgi:multidrug efflux pump